MFQLFTHPSEIGVPVVLASFEGERLNDINFYVQRASIVISQYNHLWKENMKLEKLLKVNFVLGGLLYDVYCLRRIYRQNWNISICF